MLQFIFISLYKITVVLVAGLSIIVLAKLLIQPMFTKFFNRSSKTKIEAEAIVLSINKTGLYVNDKQQVKLQMQIQPDKGRNFIAEINETIPISDLEKFAEGTRIHVVYNPFNLKEVTLAHV